MESIDLKTLYTIGHLFGVALGAGGGFMSDGMYMFSTKDKRLSRTEITFLKLGSVMVWIGVLLLVVSGALLVSLDPARYFASEKFLLKMIIVAIIIINGLIFHFVHMPILHRTKNALMHMHEEFKKKSHFIYASGAISIVSWCAAIVLGALRGISYTVLEGFAIYMIVVLIAVAGSMVARKKFLEE